MEKQVQDDYHEVFAKDFEEFAIDGIKTTIPFHMKVLQNEQFKSADYDTSFIDKLYAKK